jgi:hypothetical protein
MENKESTTHRRAVSSNRQDAHHAATAIQLVCHVGPDHVSIWMVFLATEIHGASCNNTTVSVGGTEVRKSINGVVSDMMIEERQFRIT